MKHLDLAAVLTGAEPIDEALLTDCVLVQYRPMWLREGEDQLFLAPAGGTVADIVDGLAAEGHIPHDVAALGSVFLGKPVIHRENWHRVRPKADTVIFLAIVPEGGDNTFGLIASLAVAAFAIAISGGALATLAPAIFSAATFGAGTVGAAIAGGLVAPFGTVHPSYLECAA
jgi:hypothetical protein